jgi:hypothetical protein
VGFEAMPVCRVVLHLLCLGMPPPVRPTAGTPTTLPFDSPIPTYSTSPS